MKQRPPMDGHHQHRVDPSWCARCRAHLMDVSEWFYVTLWKYQAGIFLLLGMPAVLDQKEVYIYMASSPIEKLMQRPRAGERVAWSACFFALVHCKFLVGSFQTIRAPETLACLFSRRKKGHHFIFTFDLYFMERERDEALVLSNSGHCTRKACVCEFEDKAPRCYTLINLVKI